jgi:pimeloyl-ACP methyl ester carboxylesterase
MFEWCWRTAAGPDRMIRPENQRFMAERMKARVRTAPVDHMPMVTAPSAVVDIVLEAVREIESSGSTIDRSDRHGE